jgi:hypothetical protein
MAYRMLTTYVEHKREVDHFFGKKGEDWIYAEI